jgi:copper chaperone CopZ
MGDESAFVNGEFFVRSAPKIAALAGALLLMMASGHAQSLGDVAREQREKLATDGSAPAKVVTNEDISETDGPESTPSVRVRRHKVPHPVEPVTRASNDTRAAAQWKAKIVAQERTIASLQNQIDRVNASIRFTGVSCYNCAQHNEAQIEKLATVQRMEQQLDQQKQKLEDMQESARKAGLGNAVYEP